MEKLSSFFETASEKIERFGDAASVYLKQKAIETERDEHYKTLGKLTYRKLSESEDTTAEINAEIEHIRALNERLADLQKEKNKNKSTD